MKNLLKPFAVALIALLLSGCAALGFTPEQAKQFRVDLGAATVAAVNLDLYGDRAIAVVRELDIEGGDALIANVERVRTQVKDLAKDKSIEAVFINVADFNLLYQRGRTAYIELRDEVVPVFPNLPVDKQLQLERVDSEARKLDERIQSLLSPGGGSDGTNVVAETLRILGVIAKIAAVAGV